MNRSLIRPGSRTRSQNSRGFSLVEALIATSVSCSLLLVSIGWIHQSFKLGQTVKQKRQHHQQLLRLGDRFRQDVRLCEGVLQDADGRLVLRDQHRGDVTYEVDDSVVLRTHPSASDETTHRERYTFSEGSEIRWDEAELPSWITLVVRRCPGTLQPTGIRAIDRPVDLRVRVAVGRWRNESTEGAK
jgi:hypothetical protein